MRLWGCGAAWCGAARGPTLTRLRGEGAPSLSHHTLQPAPAICTPEHRTPCPQRLTPLPPPLPLQLYKGFIYASAHLHDVDGRDKIYDGDTPVDIDAEFDVAPGDSSDVEVANAHAWGSVCLILSDGAASHSALRIVEEPSNKGITSYSASEILFYNLMMISAWKTGPRDQLTFDSQGRVSTDWNCDVLLRKRACSAACWHTRRSK